MCRGDGLTRRVSGEPSAPAQTGKKICKSCFFQVFEDEIHHTIVTNKLFSKGDRIAVAASGGKGVWRVPCADQNHSAAPLA